MPVVIFSQALILHKKSSFMNGHKIAPCNPYESINMKPSTRLEDQVGTDLVFKISAGRNIYAYP